MDLPPTPQALALLALPEELRRYLRQALRRSARRPAPCARPVAASRAPCRCPPSGCPRRRHAGTSSWPPWRSSRTAPRPYRLVAEPARHRRRAAPATTALALHGLRVNALVANRVLPAADADAWLGALAAQQRKALDEWQETYTVHEVPHLGRDPRGTDDLGALPVPRRRTGCRPGRVAVLDHLADDGVLVWHIPLPGAIREELDLIRRGDELVVTVGQFRQIVPLPSALRRCTVAGAALREGELRVHLARRTRICGPGHGERRTPVRVPSKGRTTGRSPP